MSKHFVLATDEVWRLQGGRDPAVWRARGGSDPECIAFQEMAGQGHYGAGAGTKQGIYVCTPAGSFLASINSNRAERVAAMLREGLKKWRALPEAAQAARPPQASAPAARFEWLWPKGGLGLSVTLRYLPDADDPEAERDKAYNRDALWFSKDEARQLLPPKLEAGAKHELPRALFERIARFNLVDAVRGETRAHRRVTGSMSAEITGVEGEVVTLRLRGRMEARNRPRRRGLYVPQGVKAQLLGTARFDRRAGSFVAFELLGKGVRWSASSRSRRRGAPVRQLGWSFTLTPEREDGFYVAPTHIRQYRADWARRER